VDTGLVYLKVAVGLSGGADSVLTTDQQADAYPGWFDRSGEHTVADQLRERLHRPGNRPTADRALVAVTATVGCGQPRGARLLLDGSNLSTRWTDMPTIPAECLAPYRAVAVFRVPASALPVHPTINGRQPDPAAP
jgi:hypothetical protein